MKNLLFILLCFIASTVNAQNVFPAPGPGYVGIGTSNPQGILQVDENGRHYYVNKYIPGTTADGTGVNYLLLHKIYTTEFLADHHVMGRITAIRGSQGAWNRKWTIEVNTASAYNYTRGSIVSYNEGSRLVTLTYNNERYIAAYIQLSPLMYGFSFTGYAEQASFQLVYQTDVSDVQEFTSLDPVTIQGPIGAGTILPQAPLHVAGNAVSLNSGNANQYSGNLIIEAHSNGRNINEGASLEFVIPANTDGTNPWGQSRITTVAGNTGNGNAVGKMVLGTRRYFNKLNTGVEWYYGDDLVIDGVGNIGIGTLNPAANLHVRGTAIIGNPGGGSYNENLRLPVANDDYACIALGTDNTSAGSIPGQWSLIRNPSTMSNRFSIRHMHDEFFSILPNGNLGIGTTNPTQKLAVDGTVLAKKVKVSQSATDWPDYVFDSSYQLPSLDSVSTFIQANKHLPDMPSAAAVEKDGHDLGEVQKLLLKKMEEMTLYLLQLKENDAKMQKENELLRAEIELLKKKK